MVTDGLSVTIAVSCVVAYIVWNMILKIRTKGEKLPPMCDEGFFATLSAFFSTDAPFFLMDIVRKKGKVVRLPLSPFPGQPPYIIVADHSLARKVFDDPGSIKFKAIYQLLESASMGEHFFGRDGPRAKHVRKSVAPAFAHANLLAMTKDVDECVEHWITTKLDPAVVEGSPLEISHEMQLIIANIICKIGFDYQMSEEDLGTILPAMEVVFTEFAQEVPKNPLRKLFWWSFVEGRRARNAGKTLVAFCRKMIVSYRDSPNPRDNSILANLGADVEYVDDALRARDLMVLLAAGYDTTSLSLAWALLELARHPIEQVKLRGALKACATQDEARNCQALRNVVRETLRLDIVAALGGVRETSQAWKYKDYVLPKGSIVHVPLICLHRDGSIYKDADMFMPSRWDNPNDDQLQACMPLSAGVGIVLGKRWQTQKWQVFYTA